MSSPFFFGAARQYGSDHRSGRFARECSPHGHPIQHWRLPERFSGACAIGNTQSVKRRVSGINGQREMYRDITRPRRTSPRFLCEGKSAEVLQPPPLAEPYVTLSRHTAPTCQHVMRLSLPETLSNERTGSASAHALERAILGLDADDDVVGDICVAPRAAACS
jgi:hypothetical protein